DGHGYGALLATTRADDLRNFLSDMSALARFSTRTFTSEWRTLTQRMVPIPLTENKPKTAREGMVQVPAGAFEFRVSGVEIEGGNEVGVDVQYPWENEPRRYHRELMNVRSFFIDKYPVT